MQEVWVEIMEQLHKRGYSACWMVLGAKHAGCPMERLRWFLYADRVPGNIKAAARVKHTAPESWNEFSDMPPVLDWPPAR